MREVFNKTQVMIEEKANLVKEAQVAYTTALQDSIKEMEVLVKTLGEDYSKIDF